MAARSFREMPRLWPGLGGEAELVANGGREQVAGRTAGEEFGGPGAAPGWSAGMLESGSPTMR